MTAKIPEATRKNGDMKEYNENPRKNVPILYYRPFSPPLHQRATDSAALLTLRWALRGIWRRADRIDVSLIFRTMTIFPLILALLSYNINLTVPILPHDSLCFDSRLPHPLLPPPKALLDVYRKLIIHQELGSHNRHPLQNLHGKYVSFRFGGGFGEGFRVISSSGFGRDD